MNDCLAMRAICDEADEVRGSKEADSRIAWQAQAASYAPVFPIGAIAFIKLSRGQARVIRVP